MLLSEDETFRRGLEMILFRRRMTIFRGLENISEVMKCRNITGGYELLVMMNCCGGENFRSRDRICFGNSRGILIMRGISIVYVDYNIIFHLWVQ